MMTSAVRKLGSETTSRPYETLHVSTSCTNPDRSAVEIQYAAVFQHQVASLLSEPVIFTCV